MSRDQRPGRAAMVQSAADGPEADPAVPGGTGAVEPVPVVAAKPRLLVWSLLFLLACIGGAVGVALLVPGSGG